MAYDTLYLEHPLTGKIRKAPLGFSWTTLFFGFFPALFRASWKWAIIFLFCNLFTWGLAALVYSFFFNKWYLSDLLNDGYKAVRADRHTLETISFKVGMKLPVLGQPASATHGTY